MCSWARAGRGQAHRGAARRVVAAPLPRTAKNENYERNGSAFGRSYLHREHVARPRHARRFRIAASQTVVEPRSIYGPSVPQYSPLKRCNTGTRSFVRESAMLHLLSISPGLMGLLSRVTPSITSHTKHS